MTESLNGKRYLRDQSKNGLYMGMTVFGILGFIFSLFLSIGISSLGIIAVLGAIQLATKNNAILLFNEKYFEYKPAPLASVVLMKYADVESVEITEKRINILAKGRKNALKIPLALFNKSEREEVAAHVEQLAVKV